MTKRKYQPPVDLDMEFDEALARFIQTDPAELDGTKKQAVQLVEDDTGHRVLIYATDKGIEVSLRFEGDTLWATQAQMADMFGVTRSNVSIHLKNIFQEGELIEETTCKDSLHVGQTGQQYSTKLYDLNAIISVGYRVGSKQGTMFRIWATDKLFQILTKGFYIDRERLKNPEKPDVLDEFREIAREIRTSTQNVYREVRRLCTLCQDYDPQSKEARNFYMTMENKLLWASASMTAPEIILHRADASKPDMGLTYYSGKRGPTQSDAKIANNYLAEGEARIKNRATVMWLDYVEDQLDQGRLVTMTEVRTKLDEFVKFNNWPLLQDLGKISRKRADEHAVEQYRIYKRALSSA